MEHFPAPILVLCLFAFNTANAQVAPPSAPIDSQIELATERNRHPAGTRPDLGSVCDLAVPLEYLRENSALLERVAISRLSEEPPHPGCTKRAAFVLMRSKSSKSLDALMSYIDRESRRNDPQRPMFRATAVQYVVNVIAWRARFSVERGEHSRLSDTPEFSYLTKLLSPQWLFEGREPLPADIIKREDSIAASATAALFKESGRKGREADRAHLEAIMNSGEVSMASLKTYGMLKRNQRKASF